MPAGVRGALVRNVPSGPDRPIGVLWLPTDAPRLPLGSISLHWEPATGSGWDVTARLGLATTEVHLASWHAAPDTWPHLVRPTLTEVTGLCHALALATTALNRALGLTEPGPHLDLDEMGTDATHTALTDAVNTLAPTHPVRQLWEHLDTTLTAGGVECLPAPWDGWVDLPHQCQGHPIDAQRCDCLDP
ncbi:hypothetical protein ACFVT9_28320 [Kitasatospora cineracea]|uniref:hypothetical protein n=1 Tax=Kitasatospora cineracea TaxID=88074 RepID=UPI0036DAAE64